MAINPDNAKRDLGFVVFFIIFLGVVWVLAGRHGVVPASPFLEQIPVGTHGYTPTSAEEFKFFQGQQFNPDNTSFIAAEATTVNNLYFYSGQAKEREAQKEYVEVRLSSSAKTPVNMGGWVIEGTSKFALKMPKAVALFFTNKINPEKEIILSPGDKAYIISGRSPIGSSFHLNKCMGHFTNFQTFYPTIRKECPYPKDENWPASLSFDCIDFIETLPRCEANFTIPGSLGGNDCINAINNTLGYNNCVELHKSDADFYKKVWYVYLDRSDDLWNDRHDTIVLKNKEGKAMASVTY
ncbi:MAG: hypothetical protein ABII97_02095 [Patescibacteria group bacterium]